MKKAVILISVLLTLLLAGVLHGTNNSFDERETGWVEYLSMKHFPDPMPDVIIEPMVGMPVY